MWNCENVSIPIIGFDINTVSVLISVENDRILSVRTNKKIIIEIFCNCNCNCNCQPNIVNESEANIAYMLNAWLVC